MYRITLDKIVVFL